MARKKFNFQKALMTTAAAAGGGIAAPIIEGQLSNMMPDSPKIATFGTVAVGAFLSMQSNQFISDAGIGMIGAMGASMAEQLGISLGEPSRLYGAKGGRRRHLLNPAQDSEMLRMVNRGRQKVNGGMAGTEHTGYMNAVETVN